VKLFSYKNLSILIFILGTLIPVGASIVTPSPLGSDYFFHQIVAREWAQGEVGMLGDFVLSHNHSPYPPIFHWLLVPSVWLNVEYIFARLLQVIFFSGTLGLTMFLAYKHVSAKASFYTGLTLLSSPAFIGDSIIQTKPSSLVTLLIPLSLYFYLENKLKSYLITSILSVYTWSIASFSFAYGLFFKLKKKYLFVFVATCIPLGILTLIYSNFSEMLIRWANEPTIGVVVSPKLLILQNPLYLILYLGSPLLGLPVLLRYLTKWKNQPNYIKAISIILVSSFPLTLIWVDRWVQVASIPFALLLSDWLSKRSGFVYGFVLALLIISFIF